MKRQDGFPGQLSYVVPQGIQKVIEADPLISDLFFTDIGYYPDAQYHYRERKDGIDQSILIYCTAGKGIVWIGQKSFSVDADSYIIIPAGKSHLYYSDEFHPWSIYWLHFTGKKAQYFYNYGSRVINIDKGKDSRINSRIGIFHDIFRNLERGFGVDTLEYVNLCLAYLLASFIHIDQFRLVNKAYENDSVNKSINYMLENITRNIRLNDLANEVGLSVAHYSRLFFAKTAQSPINYFNQLKMQRACQLLNLSNLSIGEVARETGYQDQFHFSRVFKKIIGVSPREYRKTL